MESPLEFGLALGAWFDNPWVAAAAALLVWWFSTGVILIVVKTADRRAEERGDRGAHLRAAVAGLPLLALGWLGMVESLQRSEPLWIYGGFLSAILIWGWFELAFLCGVIAGPNSRPCPPGVPAWERFVRAWGTIAYSEMALIATMIALTALAGGAENKVGFWTFAILFFARISAKLNLYLGVPSVSEELLPRPMRHLPSHFRTAPMNALFPLSVTALTAATACWIERLIEQPSGAPQQIGFALLAALTALALLEHWLMVLPVADARLWRWLLPKDEGAEVLAQDPAASLRAAYQRSSSVVTEFVAPTTDASAANDKNTASAKEDPHGL